MCLHKPLEASEIGTFGSHILMTVGFLIGGVILAYNQSVANMGLTINLFVAMILPATFGDLAAAAFGRKFGKRKWKYNPHKSYIGVLCRGFSHIFIDTLVCRDLGKFNGGRCVYIYRYCARKV